MNHLDDITVLVLGLGESGLAMARWCAGHGAAVRVWDSRDAPPLAAALAGHVPAAVWLRGALTDEALEGVKLVLKSPGLSPFDARIAGVLQRAAAIGLPVQGELDLFARALVDLHAERGYAPKVVAITGTNGKTTTTAMAAQLIERTGRRVAVAGNIGPTMLQTLADALALEPLAETPVAAGGPHPGPLPGGEGEIPAPSAPSDAALPPLPGREGEMPAPSDAALPPLPGGEGEMPAPSDAALPPLPPGEGWGEGHAAAASPEAEPMSSAELPSLTEDDDSAPPIELAPPPPAAPVFEVLPDVWVLELSSFQLDGVTAFEADAAAVLNVTQDHLDWHGAMAHYTSAKARIFGRRATLVVNRDDALVEAMVPAPEVVKAATKGRKAATVSRSVVRFGTGAPRHPGDFGLVDENGMTWLVRARELDETLKRGNRKAAAAAEPEELLIQRLMPADALRVRGRHNAANALAALALATAIDCPLAPMLHALRDYAGEPHRVEVVATIDGIDAVDDSKGTNVGATVAALDGLGADKAPAKLVVILGGDGKGQDFAPLAAPVARHARAVATIGRDAAAIEQALAAGGVPLQRFETLPAATRWAFEQARPGDAVLLSPACASLDMFRHYAHRAEVFVDEVRAIAADRGGVFA